MRPGDGAGSRRGWWAFLPDVALVGLSKFWCPLCVGAYSGFLASVGGGILATQSGLAGVTAVFLVLSAAGVAWTVRAHRHYGPLWLTLAGSVAVVAERLLWNVPSLLYTGVGAIVAASLWNVIVARNRRGPIVQLQMPQANHSST